MNKRSAITDLIGSMLYDTQMWLLNITRVFHIINVMRNDIVDGSKCFDAFIEQSMYYIPFCSGVNLCQKIITIQINEIFI